MAPQNAFYTINGIETLPLRMERHCENAQKVAEFLESHEKVKWVSFAGLLSSPPPQINANSTPNHLVLTPMNANPPLQACLQARTTSLGRSTARRGRVLFSPLGFTAGLRLAWSSLKGVSS